MNPYYQNLVSQIVDLFGKGEFDKANTLIQSELSLPYIPQDALDILEQYQDECRPYLSRMPARDPLQLEKWVHGDARSQEMAASALQSMNLRQYKPEVQTLLSSDKLLQEFKGELIEALMEQKLEDEYTINKDGMEIAFIPSLITPKEQDSVVNESLKLLDDWLSADNPALLSFCQQLLDQEILEMRPLDFEDIDPAWLAASLVRLVYEAMQDEEGWKAFADKHNLEDANKYSLLIEKRGE